METPSNPKTEDYTYKQGQYSPRKKKDTTPAHIEKTQKKLKYNSISRNYGNTLKPKNGGLHL